MGCVTAALVFIISWGLIFAYCSDKTNYGWVKAILTALGVFIPVIPALLAAVAYFIVEGVIESVNNAERKRQQMVVKEQQDREARVRKEAEKKKMDELQNSPTMKILMNIKTIPLGSWRFAGQRTSRDGMGAYTILVFRTTTPNGLSVELHHCWYTSNDNYESPWGHVFIDGTEIPRTNPFTSIIDSLSYAVERGYNKPDSDRMKDLLNKM